MLKEALFIGFLVDDKGVIHIPAPELGGWGQCLELFALSTPYIKLAIMGLTGETHGSTLHLFIELALERKQAIPPKQAIPLTKITSK